MIVKLFTVLYIVLFFHLGSSATVKWKSLRGGNLQDAENWDSGTNSVCSSKSKLEIGGTRPSSELERRCNYRHRRGKCGLHLTIRLTPVVIINFQRPVSIFMRSTFRVNSLTLRGNSATLVVDNTLTFTKSLLIDSGAQVLCDAGTRANQ